MSKNEIISHFLSLLITRATEHFGKVQNSKKLHNGENQLRNSRCRSRSIFDQSVWMSLILLHVHVHSGDVVVFPSCINTLNALPAAGQEMSNAN